MRLMPITAEDEDLSVRLECDPVMMRDIGGPRLEADVRASHRHRLDLMAKGLARLVVTQARADPDVCAIHAYPAVTNTAANAITRKIA